MNYVVRRAYTPMWCEACGTAIAPGAIYWHTEPGPYDTCGNCAVFIHHVEHRNGCEGMGDRVERSS